MNIVLFEPEIPQNTGNIVRTCAATGAKLHLIEPLGFDISEKAVKRAGLDYWKDCEIFVYKNLEDFYAKNKGNFYYASTKASKRYDEVDFNADDYIFFGPETRGLPEELLHDKYEFALRIPMKAGCRSLNLSNSVAIVLFEALRQQNFSDLQEEGHLTKF